MIRENKMKARLKRGESLIGTFVKTSDPAVVEVMALAGFEFIVIDNEHTAMNIENTVNLLRTAEIYNLPAIVRVRTNQPVEILQVLDAGALGVQCPQVSTRADAEALVQAVKYTPVGSRGFGSNVRAAGYGALDPQEYPRLANENTLIACHCETGEAVENLDEILAVDCLDVIFIGPYDLSQGLGVIGQVEHPKMLAAIDTIIQKSRAAGVAVGTIAPNAALARRWLDKGMQYILLSSDLGLMTAQGKAWIKEAKS